MPVDIEIPGDEWEAFQRDMAEMQGELFDLWVNHMEEEIA